MGLRNWLHQLTAPTAKPRAAIHEAAANARRLKGWNATDAEINTILRSDGPTLVKRARELCRTNPYAANAKEVWVAATVGTGIRMASTLTDPELREEVQAAWDAWADEADADGMTSFSGLQGIVAGALFDGGEVFVRRRPRRESDGLTVPLQLQLLEAEHLDHAYQMPLQSGTIRCGIEFDGIGRRRAYHFWRQHPGDSTITATNLDRVRVPAESVQHVLLQTRPGQIRGLPRIAPAMVRLYLLDQYDDAELDRKKTAALIAGFITQPDPEDYMSTDEDETPDDEGAVTVNWEPGTMHTLLPGEEISFSDPADVGGNYEAFQYRNLLSICACLGLPYHSVTGDVEKANYSSLRAALVDLRRRIVQVQRNTLLPQFCRPVWHWWVDQAVLSGAIGGDAAEIKRRVKWITPKWEWVDPLKDRQAEALAVEKGFKARSDVVLEEGYDPQEVDERIAADQERAARLGLHLGDGTTATPPAVDKDEEDAQDDERQRGAA